MDLHGIPPQRKDRSHAASLAGLSNHELEVWPRRMVCVLGPCGVGKTTLCRELQTKKPELFRILGSTTTRQRSRGDQRESNYRVVGETEFMTLVERHEFLHWHRTANGLYGLEKRRLRELVEGDKVALLTYRSGAGHVVKSVLPRVPVLELRARLETLEYRIIKRARVVPRPLQMELSVAKKDLSDNHDMYGRVMDLGIGYWCRLDNGEDNPPISRRVVDHSIEFVGSCITQ